MRPIEFDSISYRIDGKPVYLNSGELHYFRVPRKDWRERMRLLRQAGGNCIATYIPWLIHEPREGDFRFAGPDHLHIEAFLETAAEMNLHVIARPGPYQYSELVYAGLPAWLCDGYPQLLSRDLHDKPRRILSVSYLHPLFLEKTKRWFDRVCPIIARHTVSRGGPVAFTQIDNELMGIHIWFGGLDYNRETMGFGTTNGLYPRFLEKRYQGDIDAMNRACGTTWKRFRDAMPVIATPASPPGELRRARDYFEFYRAGIAQYAATLAKWMREHGIDTPLVHNSANPDMNPLFDPVIDTVPPPFLLGSDHYYNLNQNWKQNNPTPQYAAEVFASNEMLRLRGFPPTVFELPGGSLSDWPPITPQDSLACYMTNLALGMKGHNYYIFTGGPNVPGTGMTGEVYDYGAAIGPFGEKRPLYHAQKKFGRFLKKNPWLTETQGEYDFRIAIDYNGAVASHYWPAKCNFPVSADEIWRATRKGILSTAFCAALLPELTDLSRDQWTSDTTTPVVVPLASAMSNADQQRILRFVRQGGRVLLGPVLPDVDENFQPCPIIAEALGKPILTKAVTETQLTIAGIRNVFNNGEVFLTEKPPRGARPLGVDEKSGKTVAWTIPLGKGRIVFLGLLWHQAMREHERMLTELLAHLGLMRRLEKSNPNIWCTLRTNGERTMLFMMNLLTSRQQTQLRCRPAWSAKWIDCGNLSVPAMTVETREIAPPAPKKQP